MFAPPRPWDAFKGKRPRRRPQRRLGRRLEEVAKPVGGGYCRLQMPLSLALGVRETVAGHRLGALEGPGGGGGLPPRLLNASLPQPHLDPISPNRSSLNSRPLPSTSLMVVCNCFGTALLVVAVHTTRPPAQRRRTSPGHGARLQRPKGTDTSVSRRPVQSSQPHIMFSEPPLRPLVWPTSHNQNEDQCQCGAGSCTLDTAQSHDVTAGDVEKG